MDCRCLGVGLGVRAVTPWAAQNEKEPHGSGHGQVNENRNDVGAHRERESRIWELRGVTKILHGRKLPHGLGVMVL